ncbi:MAG: hypothetical protein JNN13_02480 [Planctomycetes bacterium]|nr:hypothetical protein [Planctomycetota bacterium]
MNVLSPFLLCVASGLVLAQEPPVPAVAAPTVPAAGVSSVGFGRAASYREALAFALEEAVAKVKGVQIVRGAPVRDRLVIVERHADGSRRDWFDGVADGEHGWVQQQIAGFVSGYEVEKRQQVDGGWEVTVRATVATAPDALAPIVVEVDDQGLRRWRLSRFESDAATVAFDTQAGEYRGPAVARSLRTCPGLSIAGGGARVNVGAGAAPAEREKDGQQVVASHRVVLQWGTLELQSAVERSNIARPSNGPRPEYVIGGAVEVSLRIDDLVRGVVVLDEHFAVPADVPAGFAADRVEAAVQALADKACAVVAQKIFFALRPPAVLRKWAGEKAGQWLVEVSMPRAVAAGFRNFEVGLDGSLASPDWQPIAPAALVGGTATSCTFRIDIDDATAIDAAAAQVRPLDP